MSPGRTDFPYTLSNKIIKINYSKFKVINWNRQKNWVKCEFFVISSFDTYKEMRHNGLTYLVASGCFPTCSRILLNSVSECYWTMYYVQVPPTLRVPSLFRTNLIVLTFFINVKISIPEVLDRLLQAHFAGHLQTVYFHICNERIIVLFRSLTICYIY